MLKNRMSFRVAFCGILAALMTVLMLVGPLIPTMTYVAPAAAGVFLIPVVWEFGGKTGTSNNHSDAWFMGVSPNLVVGAWVGGEYRCIHFRTGALGQGSRTALPICGYFLEAVFGDPAFQKYHGKFQKPDGTDIDRSMYECSYAGTSRRDTLDTDSLNFEEEILIDEDGNPIEKTTPGEGNKPAEPTSTEKEINFDEL